MAPAILKYLRFVRGTSAHTSRSIPYSATHWPRYGKVGDEPVAEDEVSLNLQADVAIEQLTPGHSDLKYRFQSRRKAAASSLKTRNSKYGIKGGWRGGARFAFYTAVAVLFINVILLIVCSTALKRMDAMTMVYIGSCTKTERINAGIHLVVNLLSTCLLAASNYCMQLLSAPTREDIDAAHAQGRWLDIGIPSLRNLRSLRKRKTVLWWILAISSVPLHLLYNSVFFSAIATNDYHILYATPEFVTGAEYDRIKFPDTPEFDISSLQSRAPSLVRLDRKECIRTYAQDFVTDRKDVIAVVANVSSPSSSLLKISTEVIPPKGLTPQFNSFAWICDDPKTVNKTGSCCNNKYGFVPCSRMIPELEALSSEWWRSGGFDIDYCLAETFPPDCHEHFAPPIMAPVLFFNIFKAIIMWYVAFRYNDKPIVTVGDAIESFIKNPDPTTQEMCLADHAQIEHNWSKGYIPQPIRYQVHPQRWYRSATPRQWWLLSSLFAIAAAATGIGIGAGIANLNPPTLQQAWRMGMGTVRQQNIISGLRITTLGSNALFISALIANSPQALFSFMFLVYSTVFNLMFLGREWDKFATHPKGRLLRVSEPVGDQKSTYILQIPYKYAIVMLGCSGILHWLVSQSIFLANISIIPLSGLKPLKDEITSCAYSPKGMVFVLVLGFVMIAWLVANGVRKYSGKMVLVRSNSAAISAACHVRAKTGGERDAMVLRPLRWGATGYYGQHATMRDMKQDRSIKDIPMEKYLEQMDQDLPTTPQRMSASIPLSKYNSAHQHLRNTSRELNSPEALLSSWLETVDTAYPGNDGSHMEAKDAAVTTMPSTNNDHGNNNARRSWGYDAHPSSERLAYTVSPLNSPPSSSTSRPLVSSVLPSPAIDSPFARQGQQHRRHNYHTNAQATSVGSQHHYPHQRILNTGSQQRSAQRIVKSQTGDQYGYQYGSDHDDTMFKGTAFDHVGHCSFNDGPVETPVHGRFYS